jgi:hypothetical protein
VMIVNEQRYLRSRGPMYSAFKESIETSTHYTFSHRQWNTTRRSD